MSQQQDQQLTAGAASQYLAEVCNTYAATLDPVARRPFSGHVQNCFTVIATHIEEQRRHIEKLNEEIRELQEGASHKKAAEE